MHEKPVSGRVLCVYLALFGAVRVVEDASDFLEWDSNKGVIFGSKGCRDEINYRCLA
jgi:hypothetical protein